MVSNCACMTEGDDGYHGNLTPHCRTACDIGILINQEERDNDDGDVNGDEGKLCHLANIHEYVSNRIAI
eukprot:6445445-Ditylum_brightwellii.AAC.1